MKGGFMALREYTDEELFGVVNYALGKFWDAVESELPDLADLDSDRAGIFFTAAEAAIRSRLRCDAVSSQDE
jgi:hypothetical protein